MNRRSNSHRPAAPRHCAAPLPAARTAAGFPTAGRGRAFAAGRRASVLESAGPPSLCLRIGARAPRGFTLVELMVVLVVIGILSAMILPEMRGTFEDALLRSSARCLEDVFGLAYSRAVTRHRVQRVRLDRRTGHYVVEQAAEEATDDFVPVRDVPGSEGTLDPRIAVEVQNGPDETSGAPVPQSRFASGADLVFGPAEGAIAFYPDGTADEAQVLLRDRAGFQLALRIDPITARVRVIALVPE